MGYQWDCCVLIAPATGGVFWPLGGLRWRQGLCACADHHLPSVSSPFILWSCFIGSFLFLKAFLCFVPFFCLLIGLFHKGAIPHRITAPVCSVCGLFLQMQMRLV